MYPTKAIGMKDAKPVLPIVVPGVVRYRTEDGVFTAIIVKVGPKYAQMIMMDSSGIRIKRVPKTDQRHMKAIDYDLERAKSLFRDAVLRYNNGHISNSLTEALSAKSK